MRQIAMMIGMLTILLTVGTWAQQRGQAPAAQPTTGATITSAAAVDVTHAEIERFIKLAENNPMKSAESGSLVAFIWFEYRKPGQAEQGGQIHSSLTEIYYIVHGSATFRTGGLMRDPKTVSIKTILPGTPDVDRFSIPTFRGKIEGGVSRQVTVGDVVLMPPNTIHAWEAIGPDGVGYLNLRLDPTKTLRAGYTHPLLAK